MSNFWELTLGLVAVFVGVEVGRLLASGFVTTSAAASTTTTNTTG